VCIVYTNGKLRTSDIPLRLVHVEYSYLIKYLIQYSGSKLRNSSSPTEAHCVRWGPSFAHRFAADFTKLLWPLFSDVHCIYCSEPYTVREARIHVRHVRDLLKSVGLQDAYASVDCNSLSLLNIITSGNILGTYAMLPTGCCT